MSSPLVTIITPTYNRAYILPSAITSVLQQTYTNFEYIIVDDGSIDNTQSLISSFKDSRIRYISSQHKGVSTARNIALENAKGEWIAYIDSDNELYPQYLSRMITHVMEADTVIYALPKGKRTQELYINGTLAKSMEQTKNFPDTLSPKDIGQRNFYFDINGFMHHRKVIDEGIRFDEVDIGSLEDWDFGLQIADKYPHGLLYVKEELFHYHQRFGTDGIVSNETYSGLAKAFAYVYQKHQYDKILEGQRWYPQRVEKYNDLQKAYDQGKAPKKYLLPFQ